MRINLLAATVAAPTVMGHHKVFISHLKQGISNLIVHCATCQRLVVAKI